MSSANTAGQEQSANKDKSVFTEQGRSELASEVNKYGTDVTNNSANVENLCHGVTPGKDQKADDNKNKSS